MHTLRLAAGISLVETAGLLAGVAGHDDMVGGVRLLVGGGLVLKLVFLRLLLRRSAGAALAVMLFEAAAVIAAVIGPDLDLLVRGGLVIAGTATIAIIAASLHVFPTPEIPPLTGRPPR